MHSNALSFLNSNQLCDENDPYGTVFVRIQIGIFMFFDWFLCLFIENENSE